MSALSDMTKTQGDPTFASSILEGLRQPQKRIDSKWLYDEVGSRLFEAITALDAYYPTRTEIGILETHISELARLLSPGTALVELGSGASRKTRLLLDALPMIAHYAPVDVAAAFMEESSATLEGRYPDLAVHPVVADFTTDFDLPDELDALPKLLFFPGSTIGNLSPDFASSFLAGLRRFGRIEAFVVGVDLVKDPAILIEAYDDPAGVTAAFNKNLLCRINRELGAEIDLGTFTHQARWNTDENRIEMRLVSLRTQTIRIMGEPITFATDETIHTENAYKYTPDRFRSIANEAGWRSDRIWMDAAGLYSVHILTPASSSTT